MLIAQNKKSPQAFFEYLISLQGGPAPSFLPLLSSVIASEGNMRVKLRIFLGVCGLYKGGPFSVPAELYDPMFHYLATESSVTHK